MAASQGSQP
jgi:hypothetical protein